MLTLLIFFMVKEVSDKVVIILIVFAVIAAVAGTMMVYHTANISQTQLQQLSPDSGINIPLNDDNSGEVSVFVVNPIRGAAGG